MLGNTLIENMDQSARDNLSRSFTLTESLFQDLYNNTVKIKHLELIIEKNETFLAVANVVEKYKNSSIPLTSSALKNTLLCREKDLKVLEDVIATVRKLQYFFREIRESELSENYIFNHLLCQKLYFLNNYKYLQIHVLQNEGDNSMIIE